MGASLEQATNIMGAVQLPLTTDLGILLLIGLSLLTITLWRGSDFVASLMLALYPTLVLAPRVVEKVPAVKQLPTLGLGPLAAPAIVFLVILIVVTVAIYRYMNDAEKPEGPWRYIEAVLLALTAGGALFSTTYHVLGTHTLLQHSNFIDAWFATEQVLFMWLCAPLVALLVVARR